MIWYKAIYYCGRGHRYALILGKAPKELAQAHGIKQGGLPKCNSLLVLAKVEENG
jgi:hypothetical protein